MNDFMRGIDDKKKSGDFYNEIDFRDIFFVLAQGKKIIAYVTIFLSIVGIIYSLFLPNLYKSEALLAPVDDSSSLISGALNQYSAIAGLAGIPLTDSDSSSNSKKAIEFMTSLSFFENYILQKIFLPDLMAVQSWDEKKNKIIYDENIFKMNSNTWVRDFSFPQKLIPSAQESFEIFIDDHFSIQEDQVTGYILLSIKHQSPLIAKEWAQIIFEEVNAHFRKKDKIQSEKAVEYLNKQISTTNLSEIKIVTASLLQKEIQKLTLVEAREEYVFEYVYPPLVMERKSEPNRILILILFFIIGAFSGSIIAFFKHYFSEEKNDMDRIES